MVSVETFRQMALVFPGTTEQPHFEKTSFRVNKKIFATLSGAKKEAVLKFSLVDQSVFCLIDPAIIYPVKGAWGKQGWTIILLPKITRRLLKDAITLAYKQVAP